MMMTTSRRYPGSFVAWHRRLRRQKRERVALPLDYLHDPTDWYDLSTNTLLHMRINPIIQIRQRLGQLSSSFPSWYNCRPV